MNTQNPVDPLDKLLRDRLGGEAPDSVQASAEHQFHAARCALRRRRMKPSFWSWLRAAPARAALVGAGAACGLAVLVAAAFLLIPARTAWADVVKRFGSVPYFNATVFFTEDPQKETERIEFWVARDQRIRLHQRGRVFFGKAGRVLKVYDFSRNSTGEEMPFDNLDAKQKHELGLSKPLGMIEMMGRMGQFSLDGFLALLRGNMVKSPPLKNADASIASNMNVFDVTNDRTPEWMRIWVLKDSGLPVRLRNWDPRRGESLDVVFDYMNEQPDEAFDPAAFLKAMPALQGQANKMQALLKDPGGRALTPAELFEKNGYHMPDLVEAGRTEDGVLWVRSRNAVNRTPENRTFYGFGKLEDDLGQEYIHRFAGHFVDGDKVLEYFVPLNYKQGFRAPMSYTLTCWSQPYDHRDAGDVVGAISMKEWKDGASPVPAFFEDSKAPGDPEFLQIAIGELRIREDWDAIRRLLAMIPGEPETNGEALFREKERLNVLVHMNQADDALKLAARLYPILKDKLVGDSYWQAEYVVRNYVLLLVRAGKKDEARAVCAYQIPRLRAEKPAKDIFADRYAHFVGDLWMSFGQYNLAAARLEVIGFDAPTDKRLKEYLKSFGSSEVTTLDKDPRFEPWREYVRGIAKLYDTRPLPADLEVLTDAPAFAPREYCWIELPGHPGYKVTLFRDTAEQILSGVARERYGDQFRLEVPTDLRGKTFNVTCVYRAEIPYDKLMEQCFAKLGMEVFEQTVRRGVWVARYDGRKLPPSTGVRPLRQPFGTSGFCGGNSYCSARSLLTYFSRAVNFLPEDRRMRLPTVLIIDETGLPAAPGPGKTEAQISLTRRYDFYSGDAAIEPTKKWFQDNFGITFTEEEREVKVLSLRPLKQP